MRPNIGDTLCDMHDGYKHLPPDLDVSSYILVRNDNASNALAALLSGAEIKRSYTNKYLVVIDDCDSDGNIMAAYSYDGRYFGLVCLHYQEEGWIE